MVRKRQNNCPSGRYEEILKSVVREFIRSGKPVGSRRLSKTIKEELSPATIRNVMADLEDEGYLIQPHTSAGRVPTPKGYRFFVDRLTRTRQLSDRKVDRIRSSLMEERNPGRMMSKTSQILSSLSDNVGFVLVPPLSLAVMKHIEFVKISPRRVLVILVSQRGFVQQKIIDLTEEMSQADLDQASHYLVKNYEGQTLIAVRDSLLRLMMEDRARYDRMLRNVILLSSQSLLDSDPSDDSKVYLGGTSHIIEKAELTERQQLIGLFQAFEEKDRLFRILNECVREDRPGPSVIIGLDKHLPGMDNFALISAPYAYDGGTMGTLGILGPCRMEYDKAIGVVDSVARLFGSLLSDTSQRN